MARPNAKKKRTDCRARRTRDRAMERAQRPAKEASELRDELRQARADAARYERRIAEVSGQVGDRNEALARLAPALEEALANLETLRAEVEVATRVHSEPLVCDDVDTDHAERIQDELEAARMERERAASEVQCLRERNAELAGELFRARQALPTSISKRFGRLVHKQKVSVQDLAELGEFVLRMEIDSRNGMAVAEGAAEAAAADPAADLIALGA